MKTKTYYCKDGTKEDVCIDCIYEVAPPPPCEKHGGLDNSIIKGLSKGQRWAAVIGLTALSYFVLYKAGVFKKDV